MLSALIGLAGDQATRFLSSYPSYYYSEKLQKQSQKWQERMSNTAHQREVKDLRLSGINPLLTATGGVGASTPTGSAGTIQGQGGIDPMQIMGTLANIRNQTNSTNAEVALKGSQIQDIKTGMTERLFRIEKLKADTNLSKGERHKLDAQIKEIGANIRNLNSLSDLNVTNAKIGAENLEDASRRADFIRRHPGQAGFGTGVGFWTGELGKLFSGSMSIGRK